MRKARRRGGGHRRGRFFQGITTDCRRTRQNRSAKRGRLLRVSGGLCKEKKKKSRLRRATKIVSPRIPFNCLGVVFCAVAGQRQKKKRGGGLAGAYRGFLRKTPWCRKARFSRGRHLPFFPTGAARKGRSLSARERKNRILSAPLGARIFPRGPDFTASFPRRLVGRVYEPGIFQKEFSQYISSPN